MYAYIHIYSSPFDEEICAPIWVERQMNINNPINGIIAMMAVITVTILIEIWLFDMRIGESASSFIFDESFLIDL
jgi:hypothetical protein